MKKDKGKKVVNDLGKNAKGLFKEFKAFIMRGNVVDLAVAVVIGGAFTSIVNSLVADIISPLIGILIGGIHFSELAITVGEANVTYGNFIQNVIEFLIKAAAIFVVIKVINKLSNIRKKEEKAAAPAAKPDNIVLLEEIRDLLKEKK